MNRPITARGGIRIVAYLGALALIAGGAAVFSGQINAIRDAGGSTLDMYPAELLLGALGLLLIGCGITLTSAAIIAELVLLRRSDR
ncbi:hypothetical protein [Leucobacter chromiireducens]|nr:hypothetical protein [Leucobacter chromiireducens]